MLRIAQVTREVPVRVEVPVHVPVIVRESNIDGSKRRGRALLRTARWLKVQA